MTIYIIYYSDGDRYEPVVYDLGYVTSKDKAIDIINELNNNIPQFSERIAKLESRVCSYFHHLLRQGREQFAGEWFNSVMDKIKIKYPHLSSEYGIEDSHYSYGEVKEYGM